MYDYYLIRYNQFHDFPNKNIHKVLFSPHLLGARYLTVSVNQQISQTIFLLTRQKKRQVVLQIWWWTHFVPAGWTNHWEVWTLITQKPSSTACSQRSGINSSLSIIGPGGNYSHSSFCVPCFSTIYWLSVDSTLPTTLCRLRQKKSEFFINPRAGKSAASNRAERQQ